MQVTVRIWADDASFMLNKLERLNENDSHFLSGKLNLDKIGALGMSFGVAATAQHIIQDERVKARINMDGGIQGDLIDTPIECSEKFHRNTA